MINEQELSGALDELAVFGNAYRYLNPKISDEFKDRLISEFRQKEAGLKMMVRISLSDREESDRDATHVEINFHMGAYSGVARWDIKEGRFDQFTVPVPKEDTTDMIGGYASLFASMDTIFVTLDLPENTVV